MEESTGKGMMMKETTVQVTLQRLLDSGGPTTAVQWASTSVELHSKLYIVDCNNVAPDEKYIHYNIIVFLKGSEGYQF